MHLADLLSPGAELADLIGESLLVGAVGIGFLDIGGVLRRYQTRLVAQAEEELRLTEVIGAKDQLIDSIAHEIRTPVTAVLGLSSELSSGVFAHEETVEIAALVTTESRRLAHLVDNLVYQSRSEIGTLASSGETVVLRDSLQAAWHLLGLDSGALHVDGDENVTGDRRRLEHIFVNVFDNSARHGSLPVNEDGGPGITDDRQKLFGRYDIEGDGHRPNTIGLGLPVSRMLARHGRRHQYRRGRCRRDDPGDGEDGGKGMTDDRPYFVALPEAGRGPGVVVLHEAWGLTPDQALLSDADISSINAWDAEVNSSHSAAGSSSAESSRSSPRAPPSVASPRYRLAWACG